jgi:hypothetical protein
MVDNLAFLRQGAFKTNKLASTEACLKCISFCSEYGDGPPRSPFKEGVWLQMLEY